MDFRGHRVSTGGPEMGTRESEEGVGALWCWSGGSAVMREAGVRVVDVVGVRENFSVARLRTDRGGGTRSQPIVPPNQSAESLGGI